MRTENGIAVDFEALNQLLVQADVLTIGFMLFPERVLVDVRANGREGQMVTIVEPVASVQERYLWLGQHRGAFGAPEAFSFIVWPHTVSGLIERDVLAPLRARLGDEARRQLDAALATSAEMERRAVARAVGGAEEWPALWESGTPRKAGGA